MSGPTEPDRSDEDRVQLAQSCDATAAAAASTIVGEHPVIEIINTYAGFGPVETFECRWAHATKVDDVLADVLSRSYVSALPRDELLAVLTRTREAIERHLGSVEAISYPYRTTAFWTPLIAPTAPA